MVGVLVPAAGVGGVVLNGWWAKRGGQAAIKAEAKHQAAVDWQAHVDDIRSWTEVRLAAMVADLAAKDTRLERMEIALSSRDDRIVRLEREMGDIRQFVEALQRKYNAAIRYIRRLHQQLQLHVPAEDLEAPPEDIVADLQ